MACAELLCLQAGRREPQGRRHGGEGGGKKKKKNTNKTPQRHRRARNAERAGGGGTGWSKRADERPLVAHEEKGKNNNDG